MISLPLFRRSIFSAWKLLLIFFALTGMYTSVIIYMYDPALAHMLNDYQQALSGFMSAMGMTGVASNLLEFMHIYLYGFIMLVFPAAFSVILAVRFIVRYNDSGSMACLLATPNSRMKIIATQAAAMLVCLTALIFLTTVFGIFCCEAMFPGELDTRRYIVLNAALLLLHWALAAFIFFAACAFHETKWFYLVGAGLPVLFFLCNMLGNMGESLSWLRALSLFSLFPGADIAAGSGGSLWRLAVLGGFCLVFFPCGTLFFKKKDLPL